MSKPGEISAVFRPGDAVRVGLLVVNGGAKTVGVGKALAQSEAIIELGDLLEEAFKAKRTADGRIDSRDVAHFVLVRLGKAMTKPAATIEERLEDDKEIDGFAKVWTRAVEESLGREATPHLWYDVAARILNAVKGRQ